MTALRASLAAALLLLGSACRAGSSPSASPATQTPLRVAPSPAECVRGADRDDDGLSDACELALAQAFAPVLMQNPNDCEWRTSGSQPRIAGGYVHVVQAVDAGRVRIAYLPAYRTDCGWDGPKCLLPGVDCRPHAGDSEAIVIEALHTADGWRPAGVFLSAHCFDGDAPGCDWFRDAELAAFDWSSAGPVVWVSEGRHANYARRRDCDRGHRRLDVCGEAAVAVAFPIADAGNLGSAARPATPGGCIEAPADVGAQSDALECFWTEHSFRGWQPDAPGVTSYARYLDEIAGFIAPLDRLAWLAGCWARRGESPDLDEVWMAPRGGMMLGIGRVVRDGAVVSHEAMRIEARGERLVFIANPSGQAEAEFMSTTLEDDVVVFQNPQHDFPQRVIYRHAAGDSLHARIEGTLEGEAQGVDFRLGRARCDA